MNVLSVEHVSKRLGERVLFEDVSFGLAKGDKVALVARNGAGKTSLLRILAGQDSWSKPSQKWTASAPGMPTTA